METSQSTNYMENRNKVLELIKMLHENETLVYEKIYKSLFDIVFVISDDFHIIDASPSVKRALGFEETEVEGDSIFTLSNSNESLKKVFDTPSNGQKYVFEVPFVHNNGSIRQFEVFATIININETKMYIMVASDITDKKYAQDELKRHSDNIEKELEREKAYRLQQNVHDLRRRVSIWLIGLIVTLSVITPVLAGYFQISESYVNSNANIVLLLCNGLILIVSTLFNAKDKQTDNEN